VTASVETFLTDLHGRGVTLWVEGDKLKLRAAEGVLSPEMTDAVRGRKAEILAFLRPEVFVHLAHVRPAARCVFTLPCGIGRQPWGSSRGQHTRISPRLTAYTGVPIRLRSDSLARIRTRRSDRRDLRRRVRGCCGLRSRTSSTTLAISTRAATTIATPNTSTGIVMTDA